MTDGSAPDLTASNRKYQKAVSGYDRQMRRVRRWQGLAVDRLFLRDGETVLDVACGTGLNFAALQTAVGQRGRVIGVDASPDMVAPARQRVRDHGWQNVRVIEAAVEEAEFGAHADAALFSFTHDVLQSRAAIANVVAHLAPGARVSIVGAKYGPRWALPLNVGVRIVASRYVTTYRGLDRPWQLIEPYLADLQIEPLALGGAYVGWASLKSSASTA
jgi:SAM-dependent methyltransferase